MKAQKFYSFLFNHNCKKISLLVCLWLLILSASAQHVTITPDGITPATSNSYPRLSYDALIALPNPTEGDIAYDLTFKCLRVFNGSTWNSMVPQQNSGGYNAEMAIIATSAGQYTEKVSDVALDKSGNVYVTGSFGGTINFGSISITSHGSNDVFLVKYNKNGVVQWAQVAGGTNADEGTSIAVDDSNNVYIGGNFEATATFGSNAITSAGSGDIFVAKYNAAGVNQWVRAMGGTSNDWGNGIAVDKNCNVYITGYYFGTSSFGNSTFTSKGYNDIFLVKYNSSGVQLWARVAGGASNDSGIAMAVDANENVFLTGRYQNTSTFGIISKTALGSSDVFIAKYSKDGVPYWVQSAGSTVDDTVSDIVVDNNNDIVISGFSRGLCSFGTHTLGNKGYEDIFLAKYSNNSGTATWARGIGAAMSEMVKGICTDNAGNIYLTGSFSSMINEDDLSVKPIGIRDILIVKFNYDGQIKWMKSAGGHANNIDGASIAVDNNKNIYVGGSFSNKITDGNTTKTAVGSGDYVLLRLIN